MNLKKGDIVKFNDDTSQAYGIVESLTSTEIIIRYIINHHSLKNMRHSTIDYVINPDKEFISWVKVIQKNIGSVFSNQGE